MCHAKWRHANLQTEPPLRNNTHVLQQPWLRSQQAERSAIWHQYPVQIIWGFRANGMVWREKIQAIPAWCASWTPQTGCCRCSEPAWCHRTAPPPRLQGNTDRLRIEMSANIWAAIIYRIQYLSWASAPSDALIAPLLFIDCEDIILVLCSHSGRVSSDILRGL